MSFINTPAASSSSTPANSRLRGKQPAVPCHFQTLLTPKVMNLLADDETAQNICSQFEDPDIVLAIDKLAKVSRAHQQEEQEIRLARHWSRVRQTMATILLDQLQSWGFERELYDVLKEIHRESPTVVLSLLVLFPLALLPIVELFCLPPPLPQDLLFLHLHLDDLQKQQLANEARPVLHQLQQVALRAQHRSHAITVENPDTFNPNALCSSASTVTDTHQDILSEIAATAQKTANTLTPIIEELTMIFSTTLESPTPQVNHTETIEAAEVMDFTPSEA
ncbi:hypothetical protein CVT25_007647 [Psilocybe cyanescens]|uniref:Uncharacterized protein n=1 Tax=Psilocybe cyanescens TaxID=93625 RepID=A0A409XR59_PSICY|nr:hypothetical protein CVT25_007647 [Psilocybe cyanescens]